MGITRFPAQTKNHLGTGVLTWDGKERRSDRYGTVWLMPDGTTSLSGEEYPKSLINAEMAHGLIGKYGDLICVVKNVRESTHIGDIFRSIYPRKPEIGQIIVLGSGRFFTEPAHNGGVFVGVSPDADEKVADWLNPRSLYDAHEQLVELFFHLRETMR